MMATFIIFTILLPSYYKRKKYCYFMNFNVDVVMLLTFLLISDTGTFIWLKEKYSDYSYLGNILTDTLYVIILIVLSYCIKATITLCGFVYRILHQCVTKQHISSMFHTMLIRFLNFLLHFSIRNSRIESWWVRRLWNWIHMIGRTVDNYLSTFRYLEL
jgi:hypothetical protein